MSSWDDLFVIYNEAKKDNKKEDNKEGDLTLKDIETDLDPDSKKVSKELDDEYGTNEFADDLPEDDKSLEGGGIPDEMSTGNPMNDGLGDEGLEGDSMGLDGEEDDMLGDDFEDPDGFNAMEDELLELEPEDKEKKAYIFSLLVRTTNVARKLLDDFVPNGGSGIVKKELKQLNKLVELLDYYKKYKFDALTEFDEIEKILRKSIRSIDKLAKRMVNINEKDKRS